ncbi:MAG TPA: alpha/beta hydrolase [Rhizomicrobium sp.]|jgi:pimeloyl-ACP methyl ester carboxylesterase
MVFELLFAAAAIAAAGADAHVVPSQDYAHPQQLVAVDGARRLNLLCMGHGEPVVMFESGAGDSMVVWRHVQGEIAKVTRACAYDRAGYGFSDASPRPSDARNTVDDFHRLLNAAHIHTPIVYVGHSIAGLYGALFAATYPKDVAGIVFVDPSFPDQFQKMLASFPATAKAHLFSMLDAQGASRRACAALARKGALVTPKTMAAKDCVSTGDSPDKLDDTLHKALTAQYAQAKNFDTQTSEYGSFMPQDDRPSADQVEVEAAKFSFGDKPLIVLTHSKPIPLPGATPAQMAAANKAWEDGHDEIAAKSTRGSNTVVPNTGHYIEIDAPGVVIDAVKKVVAEVRAGK